MVRYPDPNQPGQFEPWKPSTWPQPPEQFDNAFHDVLSRIIRETVINELRNVVTDIQNASRGAPFPLIHRGHVIAVACMCGLDAVSSYGYKNRNVQKFVRNHFPPDYAEHASRIYPDYRLDLVHAWNLFGDASLLPGNEPIQRVNGVLEFGIVNFVDAFERAVDDFLLRLETDNALQSRALERYTELKNDTRPPKRKETLIAALAGCAVGVGLSLIAYFFWARH